MWFNLSYQPACAAACGSARPGCHSVGILHGSACAGAVCCKTGSLPKTGSPVPTAAQILPGWLPGRSLAENQLKNVFKYTSHWSRLGTLLPQQDCCLAKASQLRSTTAEMTVQWSYCTHEGSTFGYTILGQMAPCDLQSCNFNHWPSVWSHWRIKNVENGPDSLGLAHPFFFDAWG